MNVWSFTGNLGRDAEQRHTADGDSVVSFSVAVKSGYGDKATTTWAKCSLWGKRGTAVAQYLKKGQSVGVSGEVTLREWAGKDGATGTSLEVRVNDLTLLGGRREEDQAPTQKEPSNPQRTAGTVFDMADDIPF